MLAWEPHAATAVLAVGGLMLFLGLLLPSDWKAIELSMFGASARVEREAAERATTAVQEVLSSAPAEVIAELAPSAEEVDRAVAAEEATTDVQTARARVIEWMTTQRTIPAASRAPSGVQLGLSRLVRTTEPTSAVVCAVRAPNGRQFSAVPMVSALPPHLMPPTPPGFFWIRYETAFPDDFNVAPATELEAGEYRAVWGIAASAAGARVISSTSFSLDQPLLVPGLG